MLASVQEIRRRRRRNRRRSAISTTKATAFCSAATVKKPDSRPRGLFESDVGHCDLNSLFDQSLALRGEGHDRFLRRGLAVQFAGDAALAHHHDAVRQRAALLAIRRK